MKQGVSGTGDPEKRLWQDAVNHLGLEIKTGHIPDLISEPLDLIEE